MMQYFPEVLTQVIILFIMMMVGLVLSKFKKINSEGVSQMTTILLGVVTVCVIIKAFVTVEFSSQRINEILLSTFAVVVNTGLGIILAFLFFFKMPPEKTSVLQFGTIFANCGFMAIPVTQVIFGAEGVFVVSIYMAIFQITVWTYGLFLYMKNGNKGKFPVTKIIFNPGVVGVLIGIILFFAKVKLPEVILSPIESFSSMNTPLAMIVTGHFLNGLSFKFSKNDIFIFIGCLLRLLVIPLCSVGLLYLFGLRGITLAACSVPICAPCASYTVMFTQAYGGDKITASRFLSLCTVLSIVTMPLVISIARTIA